MIDKAYLKALFEKEKLSVTDGQLSTFERYAELLVSYNKKVNLTALTSPEDIAEKHFLDSVLPFSFETPPPSASLADIGAGAGFPSCPLKIMRPDLKLTLIDSLNKRVTFLTELSNELNLNANCVHGRAEELGKTSDYREKFDVVTARAVAALPVLCEYCLPFVKVGGIFAALKGSHGEEEAALAENAVKLLGGKIKQVKRYALPCGDGRTLIVVKKISRTPPKFPRKKGAMTKKTL